MTAALREKLHRWQQIESLTGFCVVNNPGLGALASALNLDPSFLGLRPPTPQHLLLSDDLDDMDEDILSPGTLQCKSDDDFLIVICDLHRLSGREAYAHPQLSHTNNVNCEADGLTATSRQPVSQPDVMSLMYFHHQFGFSQEIKPHA